MDELEELNHLLGLTFRSGTPWRDWGEGNFPPQYPDFGPLTDESLTRKLSEYSAMQRMDSYNPVHVEPEDVAKMGEEFPVRPYKKGVEAFKKKFGFGQIINIGADNRARLQSNPIVELIQDAVGKMSPEMVFDKLGRSGLNAFGPIGIFPHSKQGLTGDPEEYFRDFKEQQELKYWLKYGS